MKLFCAAFIPLSASDPLPAPPFSSPLLVYIIYLALTLKRGTGSVLPNNVLAQGSAHNFADVRVLRFDLTIKGRL